MKDYKVDMTSTSAASFFAFGSDDFNCAHESDSDEYFIFSFSYGDAEYSIKAYGEVSEEDGIFSVTTVVPPTKGVDVSRQYVDALSAITAAAFIADRREKLVKQRVLYDRDGVSLTYECMYNFSLADKKLGKIVRKIHRLIFIENKIAQESASTLKGLKFPYKTMRDGQELFIRKAYSAIKRSSRLFVEAPTGIGKTISALYAAVRGIGDGLCDKVFYLTAKGSTAAEAFKACEKLFSAGAKVRCVQLAAKNRICPVKQKNKGECEFYKCPLMKGYAERAEEAIYELLSLRYGYSVDIVCEIAKKYSICPYELSLDLSEMCGVVICDYNYVFDPKVRIRRYFDGNAPKKKYVFLIDEAHNLVSRAKEMYSSELRMSEVIAFYSEITEALSEEGNSSVLAELKRDLNTFASKLKKAASLCNSSLIKDANGVRRGFYISSYPPAGLLEAFEEICKKLRSFCETYRASCAYDAVNEFHSALSFFAQNLTPTHDGMRYYIEIEDKEILFKCMCVDPSLPLGERLAFSSAAIFFSATFSPTEYYIRTLSSKRTPNVLALDSPFSKENRFCAIYTGVSTRFEKRDNAATVKRTLSVISSVLVCKKGNYMLYFPSYGYMKAIYESFTSKYPRVKTIIQTADMSYKQKKSFIDFFEDDSSVLRVGFCVLGGSFSEGIDLPGNRLIGTIIFGVGLPGISNEQNIIKEYYDYKDCDGYDFAYTYPGFNNVLQAAGRVIRGENDRGVIIFADDRYAEEKYKRMMPERFRGVNIYSDTVELSSDIEEFWRKR